MTEALGMRAKWLAFVEFRPPNDDGLVECNPMPEVLWLADFCFELPLIKPEWTTVIELELGAPLLAGPTLLALALVKTVLPPGPNILCRRGRLFSWPVA